MLNRSAKISARIAVWHHAAILIPNDGVLPHDSTSLLKALPGPIILFLQAIRLLQVKQTNQVKLWSQEFRRQNIINNFVIKTLSFKLLLAHIFYPLTFVAIRQIFKTYAITKYLKKNSGLLRTPYSSNTT